VAKKSKINARQRKFIDEYLIDRNGAQAAIRAGYAKSGAKVQAARMLTNANLRAEIQRRTDRAAAKADVSLELVLRQLHAILTVDIADAVDEHDVLKPLSQWPKPLRSALRGIDNAEITGGTPKKTIGHLRKIRFWSKIAAAEQLMKHLGGFASEKHEVVHLADINAIPEVDDDSGGDCSVA